MPRKKIIGFCSVENCNKPIRSLGLCSDHYQRHWQFGRLHKTGNLGKRSHPHYSIWFERKQCNALAPEWLDFWQFIKDIGERPSKNHFLIRVRDAPYGPKNFQWIEKLRKNENETNKQFWARKWRSRREHFPLYEEDRWLRRKYGIDLNRYNEILSEQDGVCAICKKAETTADSKTNGIRKLSVDHCHRTGKVRALLCRRCNTAIGLIEESQEMVDAISLYLIKHRQEF